MSFFLSFQKGKRDSILSFWDIVRLNALKQKVTVGTFNVFIAIFTRGYEGKRMTAKVAGKWLSQDPIENYKNFDYARTTRNTGAGYLINVDVCTDGVLKESTQVLTR